MDMPFTYETYVTGRWFAGRSLETNVLTNLLAAGENVVLYEPPKSGKMSLVRHTLFQMRVSGVKFDVCGMDLFNVRTTDGFLLKFGNAIIRSCASSPDEYSAIIGEYLAGTRFVFDQNRFAVCNEAVSLSGPAGMEEANAMLRLPGRLAGAKRSKTFVIIEEFQNILKPKESYEILKAFERVLSEEADSGRLCSFVFAGSAVNAMKLIFEERKCFYRMAEHLPLYPVEEKDIIDHLVKGFLTTGKVLEKEDAHDFCAIFEGNMWYVNHFASICDSITKGYISSSVMLDALNCLIAVHQPEFEAIMDDLTDYQTVFLRAVLDGVVKFSATEVVEQYGFNSSANVKRLKDALKKKEVITFNEKDEPVFLNPLFKYWLEKQYFERG